jgi:hypothetical protein
MKRICGRLRDYITETDSREIRVESSVRGGDDLA